LCSRVLKINKKN